MFFKYFYYTKENDCLDFFQNLLWVYSQYLYTFATIFSILLGGMFIA